MCGIILASASSKKRLNSSRICIISIQTMEIYCHQNSMCHLKLFSNALTLPRLSRICYRVFEGQFCLLDLPKIDQSEQELLMQATCLSPQGAHN